MLHGQRCALADLFGDLFTLAHKLTHGNEVVNQTETIGFFRRNASASIQQFQGPAQRNDAGQALCPTPARQPAQADFTKPELGMLRSHADITRQGLLQAAAVRVAVDGGDDGFVQVEQRREEVGIFVLRTIDIIGFYVAPGAKRPLPGSGHDSDP